MRAAIYDCLTANCRRVTQWYQPYVPTAATPKPYGVLILEQRVPVTRVAAFQDITVFLYGEPGDYTVLDDVVREVKELLHERRLVTADGRTFELVWVMDSKDFYDETLKAIARYVEFTIPGGVI